MPFTALLLDDFLPSTTVSLGTLDHAANNMITLLVSSQKLTGATMLCRMFSCCQIIWRS